MKILAIRIKNLASLEGDTEIDFAAEPLRSAGIFAITGATGAGKSTILDALCLALYAKTPRYLQAKEAGIDVPDIGGGSISQSDIRGILRDGTADGFAEVDFVAVDGQHYRATWNIRRARNKADGSLQPFTVALKNINTNAYIPGKKTELLPEIERLVGLNFEQFTRSVLLAQGDFTAFLKAPKDEKSSLLEKLTGTQIYSEISQRIFETHRNEALSLRDLNLQRDGIVTLTTEELDAKTIEKAAIEKDIPDQEKQVDLLNKEISWHTQLALFQNNLATAIENYNLVVEAKTNAITRVQKLKQVERVQPARSLVDAKQQTEKQLVEKSTALKEIEATLTGLQKQKDELEEILKTANEDLNTKTKTREDAKPLLDEAKRLDVQISERMLQVVAAMKERDTALENKNEYEGQLKEKVKEAAQLLEGITALQKWKEENNARQPVAQNQSLIVSKLDDAQKQLDAMRGIAENIETTEADIKNQTKEKEKLTEASTAINQKLLETQQVYDQLSEAISTVDLSALENEKTAIDTIIEDIIRAEAHWKILFSKLTDFNALNQKLADNKVEVGMKESLLAEAIQQLNTIKVQRETSLKILEKARLVAAENVETLRQQLTPGDPCPVCGSEVHPYTQHNPLLDNVLLELESVHNGHELAFGKSLQKQSSLEAFCTQLKKTIDEQEKDVALNKPILERMQTDWKKFAVSEECSDLPDEQKSTWIKEQIVSKRTLQKSIVDKSKSYQENKKEQEKQQQLITKFGGEQNQNANQIKDANRALKSYLEQLEQRKNELAKVNDGLSATEKMLGPHFAATDWFSQWKKDPVKFVERINAFAAKWKADSQKLDEDSAKHSVLLETLKGMEEKLKTLQVEYGKKEANFTDLNGQFRDFNKSRKLIFGGEAVLTIEAGLQQKVVDAQQVLDKHKENRETMQTSITKLETQKEETGKDIAKLDLQLKAAIENIQQWLNYDKDKNASTLDESGLVQLLALTPEWIETERAYLRAMDDAITEAQTVLKERNALLEEHVKQRTSERLADELNGLLAGAKELLNKFTERKNEINFHLHQDAANKKAIGTLLNTINAKANIVENWAKLNEIIGSADGKKFRQIAQEYTLDILLGYANVHLEILSKRYLLQRIPDTLGLQVLDQDMGNEVRTVFSLSGGESFLVSLALALGLASLSSSRMQVESLFIDEGFGSLDPATLNIAMDALERLHNQGRKVGVISHVQEMTERIPVQIKVSKLNSGRSRVEVLGV